jgi:hypothetical protein
MSADDNTFSSAMVICEPAPDGCVFYVSFDQPLFLYFDEAVTFTCDHPEYFQPNLPDNFGFNANDVWGPAYADRQCHGKNAICNTKSPDVGADTADSEEATPEAMTSGGHTIHSGSGPPPTPPPDSLASFDNQFPKFLEDWGSVKDYVSALLKSNVQIPKQAACFLSSMVATGDKVLLDLTKPHDSGHGKKY